MSRNSIFLLPMTLALIMSPLTVAQAQPEAETLKEAKKSTLDNKTSEKKFIVKAPKDKEKNLTESKDTFDMDVKEGSLTDAMLKTLEDSGDKTDGAIQYKKLEMHNVNTREDLEVTFWVEGKYVPGALDELDQFMRDWRRDAITDVDPKLYTLVHDLRHRLEAEDTPVHLISGFRSKKTNDKLRAAGGGQAKKSQHTLGKAADIRLPGVKTSVIRKEALEMKRGGVGYYPSSGFVHVDTGRVRQW